MATGTETPTGARAIAREAVRSHVSAIAFDLCLRDGYDALTVEGICAGAGISRSTFFRHFSSKEDALLSDGKDAGDELLEALKRRPDGESVWESLRHALVIITRRYTEDADRGHKLVVLLASHSALAAAHHEKNARWYPLLQPEIARRLGTDASDSADPRPHALIAAALGCVDATLAAWAADSTITPESILERAMASISA
jgi:AcrR family transcriptional regulator